MRFAAIVICIALVSSCGVVGLKKHLEGMDSRGGIAVRVSPPPGGPAPTYALAWRTEKGVRKDAVGFQQVRPGGLAAFSLKMGLVYRVGAFTDENGNRKYDAGEPLGVVKDVTPLSLSQPGIEPKVWELTLTREHGLPPGSVIEIPKANEDLGDALGVALGEVASLDDPRFVPEAGGSGLWRPHDFLRENTMGIYFVEPFDPNRIPLLFVYGIGGSPQDGRFLIEHLDRERYQPWFYHYPSGMRLDRVAQVLAAGLRGLRKQYGFARCEVIAHSMGGLVSRVAIYDAVEAEGANFIPRFVSISTPWGGHKAAALGIRYLKKPVPSWIDVCPNSEYLTTLYALPLPEGTEHHLIYGSGKNGKDDGVVTVESETDPRIVKGASSVTYFPYGHTEILGKDDVLARVSEALAAEADPKRKAVPN